MDLTIPNINEIATMVAKGRASSLSDSTNLQWPPRYEAMPLEVVLPESGLRIVGGRDYGR